jgi:hypothetical protein
MNQRRAPQTTPNAQTIAPPQFSFITSISFFLDMPIIFGHLLLMWNTLKQQVPFA